MRLVGFDLPRDLFNQSAIQLQAFTAFFELLNGTIVLIAHLCDRVGFPEHIRDFIYLCAQRSPERLWEGDKWHASWTYITGHTISALLAAGRSDEALAALPALLDRQHPDGSWGVTEARDEETANITLALLDIERCKLLPEQLRGALTRAGAWLMRQYRPLDEATGACWIGKELYRPRRIARTLHLSALLGCLRSGYISLD